MLVRLVRNHRHNPLLQKGLPNRLRRERLVPRRHFRTNRLTIGIQKGNSRKHGQTMRTFMFLSGNHCHGNAAGASAGDDNDFGGRSAPGSTDGLVFRFVVGRGVPVKNFFGAPAAALWTRTMEPSMAANSRFCASWKSPQPAQ